MRNVEIKRVLIKNQATHIREGVYPWEADPSHLPKPRNESANKPQLDVWKQFKPEYYAIVAVLADDIVTRAVTTLEAFSDEDLTIQLSKPTFYGNRDIFERLFLVSQSVLLNAHLNERDTNSKPGQSRYEVWQRYLFLDDFVLRYIRPPKTQIGETILKRGLANAAATMSEIQGIIPEVYVHEYHSEPSVETEVSIFVHSFPLVAWLAQLHMHTFSNVREDLKRGLDGYDIKTFYWPNFALKKDNQSLSLTTVEPLPKPTELLYEANEPLIGCPARISFGSKNAIQKLWDWYAEKATLIYSLDREVSKKRIDPSDLNWLKNAPSVEDLIKLWGVDDENPEDLLPD